MSRPFRILLVEDSDTDVQIIARALRESGFDHLLTVASNGLTALDQLRTGNGFTDLLPDLILLDLNLPGVDGHEVLGRIKSDPGLKAIPLVVLSTTRREHEVWQSYQAGANTFIQKPADFDSYRELAHALRLYWRDIAQRPGPPPGPGIPPSSMA
ncbi:MAG: response regulator [Isosphaeraceae bacterium]